MPTWRVVVEARSIGSLLAVVVEGMRGSTVDLELHVLVRRKTGLTIPGESEQWPGAAFADSITLQFLQTSHFPTSHQESWCSSVHSAIALRPPSLQRSSGTEMEYFFHSSKIFE